MQPSGQKVVLLGETAVGKSSIAVRFVRDQFFSFQESTIGAAFLAQTLQVDGRSVKFEIWDTAGQERYHSLAPMYYRGAKAALVVYDITDKDSFGRAQEWVNELRQQCGVDLVIALVGNKVDLEENRQVETAAAKAYADEQGLYHIECSAKADINVTKLFTVIAKKLPLQNGVGALEPGSAGSRQQVDLLRQQNGGQGKDGCAC